MGALTTGKGEENRRRRRSKEGCRADLEKYCDNQCWERPAASLVVILILSRTVMGWKSVSPRKISEVPPQVSQKLALFGNRVAVDIVIQDEVVLEKGTPLI